MHAMMLSLSATASMRTSSFAVAVKVRMSSITCSALGAAAALGQPSAFALASHAHDDERPPRGLCRFSLLLVSSPHATRRYKAYNANRTRVERRKAVAWTALPVVLLLSLATFGGRRAAAAVRHRMWLPQARCRSWAHRVSGTRDHLGGGRFSVFFRSFGPGWWMRDAAGAVFTR